MNYSTGLLLLITCLLVATSVFSRSSISLVGADVLIVRITWPVLQDSAPVHCFIHTDDCELPVLGTGAETVERLRKGETLDATRTDTLRYDAAGNLHAMLMVNGGSPEQYQDRVSYYSVGGKLVAADARSVAMGTTTLAGHTAFEEYRYDALGRRVWTRVRRWCDDTQGAGGGADAVACQVSTVRRTVWNGNRELAEIQMPATDSTASSTIENDTLAITRTVPGTGDSFYDANRLYGQVLYVDGLETDQPLAITRNHYADASSTTGSETYAVYTPFSVIPLWNSQGRADRSVVGGTAAPGRDGVCVDGGVTRCASVYLDQGVFPYARSGASMGSWNGTLLIDKADATGTYYRRNRSYDPATARFTQEDPIGLAGGLNAYGFASGDPANYGDPFGLCPPCSDAELRQIGADFNKRTAGFDSFVAAAFSIEALFTPGGGAAELTTLTLGKAVGRAAATAEMSAVAEGVYEFTATSGKTYVGQSMNISRRIAEHMRSGKLAVSDATNVRRVEVLGGKTAREIAEQRRINVLGGIQHLENKVNPIGPNRQQLLISH